MNTNEAKRYLEGFCETQTTWGIQDICDDFEVFDGWMSSRGPQEYFETLEKWPNLHEAIAVLNFNADFESVLLAFKKFDLIAPHVDTIEDYIFSENPEDRLKLNWLIDEWVYLSGGETFCKFLKIFEQFRRFVVEESDPKKMAYRRFMKENSTVIGLYKFPKLFEKTHRFHELWGDFNRSPMKELKIDIKNAAKYDYDVLITGETGTGKELCAHSIFYEWVCLDKERSEKKLIDINAASLEKNRLEADLFGYVKGAFTDAKNDKDGFVANANNSVLFIDEFGEMPTETQAKLLRFIECGEYYKLGSTDKQYSNVKIIAGTNNPEGLKHDVKARFRKVIHLKPIRERIHDLPILISALLPKIRESKRMHNEFAREQLEGILKDVFQADQSGTLLKDNVRELEACLIKSLENSPPLSKRKGYKPDLQEIEQGRKIINKKSQLAEALGTKRPTLDKCLREYGIKFYD